jgi:xanthine/CO dehydrogenase XdhC/CoxF family maturation factor
MLTSPPEIFAKVHQLKAQRQEFILASVIAVHGAASAKTGAKAIFDAQGLNLLGWVGGGCAESFLAREALEALKQRTPRIVTVDLDDEVFGLMPCGGKMDVYLEPHFPATTLDLPDLGTWTPHVIQFFQQLGYDCRVAGGSQEIQNWGDVFVLAAETLARKHHRALRPWRDIKGAGPGPLPKISRQPRQQLLVFGQSRITEEICRLSRLLEITPEVFAKPHSFPVGTSGAWVVVASHHQLDHKLIAQALHAEAEYVALVASAKRTQLIAEDLRASGLTDKTMSHFFAPAGLNLPTETPTQIAFSILAELLFLQRGLTPWI